MLFRSLLTFAAALLLAGCGGETHFSSAEVTGAGFGRDFELTDPSGQTRRLADFRGKAVVLFFGYTQCPDVCPTTLAIMREVMERLGPDAARVQVIFASVDPDRDTPQILAAYPTAFNPTFLGLRGDAQATRKVMEEFRVFAEKRPGSTPGTYTVDHTALSYVFDPTGRLRLVVKHGTPADSVASDLRLLLAGK